MYQNLATKLFANGTRSESVERSYAERKQLAISANDAKKLSFIDMVIKKRTIALFQMSLEAADLLGLSKDNFYDLYFKGDEIYPANLLRGMHSEGIIKIIRHHGYVFDFVKANDEICTVRFSLDNGVECKHSFTIEEAKRTPWIADELAKEDSLWNKETKEMLIHEAVKFVAKTSFRRLFKVKSKSVLNNKSLSNKELAELIFDEEIFDIETVDFEYKEKLLDKDKSSKELETYVTSLRNDCIGRIFASLEFCEALGLPKELFYDISKHSVFHKQSPSYNVRACCIIDLLREMGYLIQPENVSSKSCTVRFVVGDIERCEQITLDNLCRTRQKIKDDLENSESPWYNQTTLLLFYSVLQKILKEDFSEVLGDKKQSNRDRIRSLLFTKEKSPMEKKSIKSLLFNKKSQPSDVEEEHSEESFEETLDESLEESKKTSSKIEIPDELISFIEKFKNSKSK